MQIDELSPQKQRVALVSLVASGGLAVLKFVAAFFTGSLALYTEAFHSLTDFAATLMTLVAVKIGDLPADDDHHYGHAKVESLAALFETALLLGLSSIIAYEAVTRLWAGRQQVTFTWWAVAILVLSIVVDFNRSRALSNTARATSSAALAADAVHFSADMWSSGAVLIGLFGVWMGYSWADPAVALIVAMMIARAAYTLGKVTIDTLLDRAPFGVSSTISALVEQQPGVLALRQLRVKSAGPKLFVTMDVDVARTLPVDDISAVKIGIAGAIAALHPGADVTVSTALVALDDESVFDKIHLIARKQGLAIHHLAVQDINGRLAISFDLEVDGDTSLDTAHLAATQLEDDIRETLGETVEVESHIEPLPQRMLQGIEAPQVDHIRIGRTLQDIAARETAISDIHNLRVRDTDGSFFVHYHCRFPATLDVRSIHDVIDRMEETLKAREPRIGRIVAHAEPIGAATHKL
jgi:cation diffusion facilitator family transporter